MLRTSVASATSPSKMSSATNSGTTTTISSSSSTSKSSTTTTTTLGSTSTPAAPNTGSKAKATSSSSAASATAPISGGIRKTRLAVPHGSGDLFSPNSSGGSASHSSKRSPFHHHHHHNHHYYYYNMQRLTDMSQMDFQAALDQMRSLLSGRPHVVYKTAYYRKQTKNHWARDDPAFMVLQAGFLMAASIAYAIAFRTSLSGFLSFALYSLLWNWLLPGVVVATVGRELCNRHLATTQSLTHVKQTVEWLYAFDIHCNAFFPLFCLLYVVQFFLLPLVLGKTLFSLILSNTLYAAAMTWYWYITHLGYRSLPFLSNTELFLFPIAAVLLVFCLNLIGYPFGMGWNASRLLTSVYFY